jgi:GNAT superfamily N-acetyltransferase
LSVILRLAKLEDQLKCSELLNVLAEVTDDSHEIFDTVTFRDLISNERGSLVIAEESGKILGMASISFNLALRYNGEYCQLEELIVDQNARGKNVGGLLIEETIRLAKIRGCKEFGLYLLESTKHNQTFYEKYGFIKVGEEMRQPL